MTTKTKALGNEVVGALATGILCLLSASAHADDASKAPVCLIAGWENPASVCVAHTKSIAATCYICHGPEGKSQVAIPGLAGLDKAYFVEAMKDFKSGKRESSVMKKYALGYSDTEYEDLAEFFSKIK